MTSVYLLAHVGLTHVNIILTCICCVYHFWCSLYQQRRVHLWGIRVVVVSIGLAYSPMVWLLSFKLIDVMASVLRARSTTDYPDITWPKHSNKNRVCGLSGWLPAVS